MSTLLAKQPELRFRFSVEKFHELADAGSIPVEKGLELINGQIYEMHALGPFHCSISQQIGEVLRRTTNPNLMVREEKPILFDDFTEPVPDVALVKKRAADPFFGKSHPTAEGTTLIIEVSDSSYLKDRNVKLSAYAKAGIPEVWIVNTKKKQVEWFRLPDTSSAEYVESGICDAKSSIEREFCSLDFSEVIF